MKWWPFTGKTKDTAENPSHPSTLDRLLTRNCSRDEFFLLYTKLLQEQMPNCRVEFSGESVLRLTGTDGKESTTCLDNLWLKYKDGGHDRADLIPIRRGLRLAIGILLFASSCTFPISCSPPREDRPVIGAKNFTEQVILGELIAQQIEARSNLKVERRFYLAGSYICHQALVSGRIDAYVEYTGTALTAILKQQVDRDPERVLDTVRRLYTERYGTTVADPLGFENTFAMVVRGDDAQSLHLTTLSEAAAYTPRWHLGVGYEFEQRPDGLPGLSAAYNLRFDGPPRTMDLGLLYRALNSRQVDMIAANSTDGPIQAFGLVALQDDRHYFPPYQAVPLVRNDALRRWPQIGAALQTLAGQVTAGDMRAMNEAVDGQHRDPADVVREFRIRKNL